MPVVDDSINLPSGATLWTGSLTPGAPALTFTLADTAVAGGASVAGSITNTGDAASGPWSIAAIAGLTITPSSGSSIAAGATVSLSAVASAAGTYNPVLVSEGAPITGNPQTIAVSPGPSIVLSSSGNPQTGIEYSVTVTAANLTGPLVVTPENVSGTAVFNPTTATPAPGELIKLFGATWATTGAKQIRATAPGGVVSNTLSVNVVLAPPSTATLSGANSVLTGATHTSTVTLSSVADQTYTITWSRSNGGTGTATSTIPAGQTTATGQSSWAAAGAGRTVDFAISPSITRAGRPLPVTVSDPAPPPPPPPPGGVPQPFTLTSATSGTLPFAIGYAMRQGDVPAGSSLSFSGATAKLTVLSTWPDSSARFGIIAGTYTSAGSAVTVTPTVAVVSAGTLLTGADVQAAMGANTAVFNCGAFGTVTFSGSDFASPFITHAATSGFIEAIYRKQVGSDVHLVAWMAVRHWAGTSNPEFLPWIENGYLNVAAPTSKSATFAFSLGGSQRFSGSINLLNHQRTPLVSGSALSHWLGTDPGVVALHDTAYLQATRLVPTYRASVPAGASVVTNLPSSFTPLQQGSFPSGMGAAGYHGSIGLLPEWDVLPLVCNASDRAAVWAGLQRNAYSAGRYGIHFRDETTNRPPLFSSYPNLVLDGSSGVSGTGTSTTSAYTPNATGGTPPTYASTHHPSTGFMAYLLTGRFYHLETLQFLAGVNYLKNGNANRNGSDGIFQSSAGANTTRGVGWAIRTLAQAAAISPDGDTITTELRNSLSANVSWHHARYVAQPNNPQGWIQPYSDYTAATNFNTAITAGAGTLVFPSGYVFLTDDYYNGWEVVAGGEVRTVTDYVGSTRTATLSSPFTFNSASAAVELRDDNIYFEATWMQDFVTAAFGYALAMEPTIGSTNLTKLDEFFHWKAKSIVGRLGTAAREESVYRDAATYTHAVAPSNQADWTTGTGPWYADWGQVWTATLNGSGYTKEEGDGTLRGGNFPDATSYWANLQPAIAYAVEHNVIGANLAYQRMVGASNWSTLESNFNTAPVWSVKPPTDPLPAALAISAGTFSNAGTSTLNAVKPSGWPTNDIGGPYANWAGAVWCPDFGDKGGCAVHGSGHLSAGSPVWAGVWVFDVATQTIVGRNVPATPLLEQPPSSAYYNGYYESTEAATAGHTYAPHTYDGLIFVPASAMGNRNGGLLRLCMPGAGGNAKVAHLFDLDSPTAPPVRVMNEVVGISTSYPAAAADYARGGLWCTNANGQNGLSFIDFSDWSETRYGSAAFNAYGDQSLVYIPQRDCLVAMGRDGVGGGSLSVRVCPISGGVPQGWTTVTQSGTPPSDARCGGEWVMKLGVIVSYSAGGSYTVHKLTPPANLTSGTWVWTSETLTAVGGAVPARNSAVDNGAWSRMVYAAEWSRMLWQDGVNNPTQVMRLTGL
jgi:hypothetical protein